MASIVNLRLRMYVTAALIFAIAFAVLYMVLLYIGIGIVGILGFSALFFAVQWYLSPIIMGKLGGIRYIDSKEYPKLWALVKMLAKNAAVPEPRIAVAPRKDPNAYVFGRTKNSATLVVHEGLLSLLNDDELEAVLAHEIGHLKHNDVAMMTLMSFIPMLAYIIAQSLFFGGMMGGAPSGKNGRGSGGSLAMVGVAAFVVYFVLQLIMLSLSRLRESYADEYSALTTRKPSMLASSLLKITSSNAMSGPSSSSTMARSFCIVDSFGAGKDSAEIEKHAAEIRKLLPNIDLRALTAEARKSRGGVHGLMGIFATHPPAYVRVLRLAKLNDEIRTIPSRT